MIFEYDAAKSAANQQKHGIDFEQAKRLWEDDRRIEIMATVEPELRWVVVGIMDGKHWTAVFTWRGEVKRIISVRRARMNEREMYENFGL